MPSTETSTQPDDRERDREPERDRGERGGPRQKTSASASSKSKDLSHVPCKFYKVGGCTAGASCPFSHTLAEPGGQKETCAWFVKGNCKFGHKCALAHILPGQSMAMDRKNKKAAQLAAASNGGGGEKGEKMERGGKGGRGGGNLKRDAHGAGGTGVGAGNVGNRNPLLTGGSTAPTRTLHPSPALSTPTGRPPMTMPLKATISPSAPAPPLKDTDFASFGVLDDLDGAGVQLSKTRGRARQSQDSPAVDTAQTQAQTDAQPQSRLQSMSPQGRLPSSDPRPTAKSTQAQPDYGPIGSPPTSNTSHLSQSHTSSSRLNYNGTAFSPGTSPHHINGINVVGATGSPHNNNALSTSPFSAPGTQSIFLAGGGSHSTTAGADGVGMAASLGSGLAMMGGRKGWGGGELPNSASTGGYVGMAPLSAHRINEGGRGEYDIGFEYEDYGGGSGRRSGLGIGKRNDENRKGTDIAVEDEDLEDFLPSSLTELLTPEERNRRMSRSNSGQGPATALGVSGAGLGIGESGLGVGGGSSGTGGKSGAGLGIGHRYSRSVPAPSLLGDIRSIWADTNAHPVPPSPPTHRATPSSSFSARFDVGQTVSVAPIGAAAGGDDMGLSMSMGSTSGGMTSLSPSNASAAFLPGLHSHYLTAKAQQAQAQQQAQLGLGGGLGRGLRGTSGPLYGATGSSNSTLANNFFHTLGGSALSPPSNNNIHTHTHNSTQHTYRATPSPFDLTQPHHHHLQQHPNTARPISNNMSNDELHHSSHLLSPSSRALQSHAPGQSLPQGLAAGYSRIHALPPPPSLASPGSATMFSGSTSPGGAGIHGGGPYGDWAAAASPPGGNTSGLDSMFSRLSYSAAATRPTPAAGSSNNNVGNSNNVSPPGLQRNVSGGRYQQHGPLSPLNGPVVTGDDDDDLFSMDG